MTSLNNPQKYSPTDKLFQGEDFTYYDILTSIKSYFLSQDLNCPFFDKEILLYNHEALSKISNHVIISDSFIFINEKTFKDLVNSYEFSSLEKQFFIYRKNEKKFFENPDYIDLRGLQEFQKENVNISNQFPNKTISKILENLPVVNFIKNISQESLNQEYLLNQTIKSPFVHIKNEDFLNYLESVNLTTVSSFLKQEIVNQNKSFLSFKTRLDFSKQHKEYLISLKEKSFPAFVFSYNNLLIKNDTKNASDLLTYFMQTVANEIKSFTPLSFGLAINIVFNPDIFDEHNKYISKFSFMEDGLKIIYDSVELYEDQREALINAGTRTANLFSDILIDITNFKNRSLNNNKPSLK